MMSTLEEISAALIDITGAMIEDTDWGHIGGCLSATDQFVALYFGDVLRIDHQDPDHPSRDRLLVRGHLGPLRYAIFHLLGWLQADELTRHAHIGSRTPGHESMATPGVDLTPSGSLGMIASFGVGLALELRRTDPSVTTWVHLGDGEEQAGNVGEAARSAANLRLDNLVVILDRNGAQLGQRTAEIDGAVDVAATWAGYGFDVTMVDGRNGPTALAEAFRAVRNRRRGQPRLIVIDGDKGAPLSGAARHYSGYHELSHVPEDVRSSLSGIDAALARTVDLRWDARRLPDGGTAEATRPLLPPPVDPLGDHPDVYQWRGYQRLGPDLAGIGAPYVISADSLPAWLVDDLREHGWNAVNVGIREQHAVAVAHGLASLPTTSAVLVHLGDPFVMRCLDQVQAVAGTSHPAPVVLLGDDGGITNDRNGATHQVGCTLRMLTAVPGLRVFSPYNGAEFAAALWEAINDCGVSYIRIHNGDTRDLGSGSEDPPHVLTRGDWDAEVAVVSTGYMAGIADEVAQRLRAGGRACRTVQMCELTVDPRTLTDLLADVDVIAISDGDPRTIGDVVRRAGVPDARVEEHGYTVGASGTLPELLDAAGLTSGVIARRHVERATT